MGPALEDAVTGQVTALGIRDGDPAVLQALVDRRGFAVLAFCERACPPGAAVDAAADAFARFRAMVQVADRPADLDPEAALLSATRHAAALRMPRPSVPAATGLGRLLGGRAQPRSHDDVPALLATRADGLLDPANDQRLVELLDASPEARATEQRLRAAEHAYLTARPRAIADDVIDHIVTTMAGRPRFAAAPTRSSPSAAASEEGAVASASGAIDVEDAADPREAVSDRGDSLPAAAGSGFFAGAMTMSVAEPAAAEDPPAEEPPAEEALREEARSPVAEAFAAPAGVGTGQPETAEPVADAPPDDVRSPVAEAFAAAADEETLAGRSGTAEADEADPQLTEEWTLPPDELAGEDALDTEIAASRLPPVEDVDEEAAHLQSASGAVDEPLVDHDPAGRVAEAAAALHRPPKPPERKAQPAAPFVAAAAGGPPPSSSARGVPRSPAQRQPIPGKGALIPAGAVVTIAAIGALAASGVFGGNEPSPPLDTGIVPPRALQTVPEGEAAAVIDKLRSAAGDARRQRLADRRQALAAAQLRADPAPDAPTAGASSGSAGSSPDADADAEPGSPADDDPVPPEEDGAAAPDDADAPVISGEVPGETTP